MTADHPLEGRLVVELGSSVATAFSGRLLAGFGANVILVEPPGGTRLRHRRVSPTEPVAETAGPWFLYLASGKRSVVASVSSDGDRDRLRALISVADIVLDDHPPGVMERVGLGYDDLCDENPGLIYTSLTPYGSWGPYATWRAENINAFAMGGQMALTGEPDREPIATAGEQAWYQTGLHGFAATLLALYTREQVGVGVGQRIEVSAFEVMAGSLEGYGPNAHCLGIPTPRTGFARFALMGIYPCQDGYAGIYCTPRQVPAFAEVLGRPEIAADPRLETMQSMIMHNAELEELPRSLFADRSKKELLDLASATQLTMAPVHDLDEVARSPHLAERNFFREVKTADGQAARVPGPIFDLRGTKWSSTPSPPLGETSSSDIDRLVTARRSAAAQVPATSPSVRRDRAVAGPLSHLRVLDLTTYWMGPFCGKWLADFGADVIKVEQPSRPDFIRTITLGAGHDAPWNMSAYFNNYNRGKRSLGLNFAVPRGREVLLELVRHADVVIENFPAGYMDGLGLSFDVLRQYREDLVMVSMSGYGQHGPHASLAGVGTNMEQLSGIASLTRYPDEEQPYNTGIAYGDPIGGTAGTAAVLLALLRRDALGGGQYVDVSAHEVLVSLIGERFTALSLGVNPSALGNRDADMVPQGCYPCAGDDRWVTLSVPDDATWLALCDVIDRRDLAVELEGVAARREAEYEINVAIMGWTLLQSDTEAAAALQARGVPAAPVLTTNDLVDDIHLRLRGYFLTIDDPDLGPWPHDGIAWRLSRTPGAVRGPAPRFGADTDEVLQGLLGMTSNDVIALRELGVIDYRPQRW